MPHIESCPTLSHVPQLQLTIFLHAALCSQFCSVQFNRICSHTSLSVEPVRNILSNAQVSWCRSLSVTSVLRNAFSMCVTLSVFYSYLLSNAQVSWSRSRSVTPVSQNTFSIRRIHSPCAEHIIHARNTFSMRGTYSPCTKYILGARNIFWMRVTLSPCCS